MPIAKSSVGSSNTFLFIAICLSAWYAPAQGVLSADSAFNVSDAQGKSLSLAKPPSGQPVVIGALWNETAKGQVLLRDSRRLASDGSLPPGYADSAGGLAFPAATVIPGDFNGDGVEDMACFSSDAWAGVGIEANITSAMKINGRIDGKYGAASSFRQMLRKFLPLGVASDLDGNGRDDLLLATDSGLAVIPGGLLDCDSNCPPLADFRVYPLPGRPMTISVGRLNGDTLPDVVVALSGKPGRIAVFLSNEFGFPDSAQFMLTASGPLNMVPGANILANALGSSIAKVGAVAATRSGGTALSIMVAVRDSSGGKVDVFDNKLPGGFDHHSYSITAPNGDGWNMLGLFDSDKDGKPDLIGRLSSLSPSISAADTGSLITFLAKDSGGFASPGLVSVGTGAHALAWIQGPFNLARRVLTGGWGWNAKSPGGIALLECDGTGRFKLLGSLQGGPVAGLRGMAAMNMQFLALQNAVAGPILYADGGTSVSAPGGVGTISVEALLALLSPAPTALGSDRRTGVGSNQPIGRMDPGAGLRLFLPDGREFNLLGRVPIW